MAGFLRPALLALLFAQAVFAAQLYTGLVNEDVSRDLDLSTQVATVGAKATIKNTGSQSVDHFYVAVRAALHPLLAHIKAEDAAGAPLTVTKDTVESSAPAGTVFYKVQLASALAPGASVTTWTSFVYTNVFTAFPAEISMTETQLMKYEGNYYYFSPYTTQKQKTKVKLASSNILSKSELSPTSVSGDTVTYGPYSDVAAFSYSAMSLHFEHTRPFAVATLLQKDLEVSHWGNLAVEEHYLLRHAGAAHKGYFSRYDYQRNPMGAGVASIRSIVSVLPSSAFEIYYRDEIGNISTSAINPSDKGLEVELVPRFPLFGGWKTDFLFGYNLPLSEFLRSLGGSRYALSFPFGSSVEGLVIDELAVKIILPEGATDIKFEVPFGIDGEERGTHFAHLDFAGRPTLTIRKKNVVGEHNVNFKVTYRFSTLSLLRKPATVIVAFLAFFAACMAYVRFELPISKDAEYAAKEREEKVHDVLRRFREQMDLRDERYDVLQVSHAAHMGGKKRKEEYDADEAAVKKACKGADEVGAALAKEMEEWDAKKAAKLAEVLQKEKRRYSELIALFANERQNQRAGTKVLATAIAKGREDLDELKAEIDELLEDLAGASQ
eukprot:tig00020904_g15187.t1